MLGAIRSTPLGMLWPFMAEITSPEWAQRLTFDTRKLMDAAPLTTFSLSMIGGRRCITGVALPNRWANDREYPVLMQFAYNVKYFKNFNIGIY
jgi:hypothetical protein